MQSVCRTFLLLTATLQVVRCYRILAIFPIPLKEQQFVYRPLIEHLAQSGHTVVLLTTDPIPASAPASNRIAQIDLSFVYQLRLLENLNGDGSLDGSDMLKSVFDVLRQIAEAELRHDGVQRLIQNENESFDVVIVEWAGMTLMNAFAHKFRAPLIGITPAAAFLNSHEAVGNPNHPIGYPSIFMPFSENLTILQKISSFMFTVWYRFYYFNEELPRQQKILTELFNEPNLPDLWDIESRADLLLINSYQALGNVRATVPNTVYLGGLHRTVALPLPADLSRFIAHSSRLVYVNVDANICLNSYRLTKLLTAIELLDADIVWKWNGGDAAVNSSARIFYVTGETSEIDVLANDKVQLFVSSGGQRHIENAIHHSVPVLGLSVAIQLEHYLQQIVKYGAGTVSYIDYETKESFVELVQRTVGNSTYIDGMTNLHSLLLDQPIPEPVLRAAWWIEHVIRNRGTQHLQSTMKNLTWFEYLLIDVVAAIVVMSALAVMVCAFIFQRLRDYSKSLPFEMVTRGSKCKVL